MMAAADVWEILDPLAEARIDVWVEGGWAIDALIGRQTREHRDLDITIRHTDEARFGKTIESLGFRTVRVDNAANWVVEDAVGKQVDVHIVDLTMTRLDGDGVEVYGPGGLAYYVGAFGGRGRIAGREVACIGLDFKITASTFYEPDDGDFADLVALCGHFGRPLPPRYQAMLEARNRSPAGPDGGEAKAP